MGRKWAATPPPSQTEKIYYYVIWPSPLANLFSSSKKNRERTERCAYAFRPSSPTPWRRWQPRCLGLPVRFRSPLLRLGSSSSLISILFFSPRPSRSTIHARTPSPCLLLRPLRRRLAPSSHRHPASSDLLPSLLRAEAHCYTPPPPDHQALAPSGPASAQVKVRHTNKLKFRVSYLVVFWSMEHKQATNISCFLREDITLPSHNIC